MRLSALMRTGTRWGAVTSITIGGSCHGNLRPAVQRRGLDSGGFGRLALGRVPRARLGRCLGPGRRGLSQLSLAGFIGGRGDQFGGGPRPEDFGELLLPAAGGGRCLGSRIEPCLGQTRGVVFFKLEMIDGVMLLAQDELFSFRPIGAIADFD